MAHWVDIHIKSYIYSFKKEQYQYATRLSL
jgi:hypothetical protein